MGLPSLPLTWWAENIGGPTDFGDYQIAHLPPPSASVGAARWAAIFRTAHYQRGTWERQRGWDAEAIPCGPFCGVVTGEQRKSKDHGSLAAFLHPFAAVGKRMSRRSAKYPFLWRKNERAVGDAVPYGRIRQGAAENAAQAISAHTADRPVHRLGREVIVCGDPWRQR